MKGGRRYLIGVRGKLVLSLLLLVVLSMWLLGLSLMQLKESALRAQLAARVKVIASVVEHVLEAGQFPESPPATPHTFPSARVSSLLHAMGADPEVAVVEVFDGEGRLLATGPSSRNDLRREGPEGEKAAEGSLSFTLPLTLGAGKQGTIGVRFSRNLMQQQLALSHLRTIIQLIITILVLLVFINILVSLTVLAPIRNLLSATESIGAGDWNHRVSYGGTDEFGDLARSFNTMLERLREGEDKDRHQLASLRQAHSDLQAKEKQLVQSEKMAAVGRVAAGVAHEVGNPLGSVTGYLAMVRDENLSPEERKEYLERTEKELARINRIMHDLLNYARPPIMEVTDVDLNILLRDVRQLLATQPELKNISLAMNLGEGLPPVRGDYHKVRQLVVNIILNAVQSMPDGGPVSLKSFRSPGEASRVGIAVTDRGPGIPDEELPHIFEPFFTSRKGGRGSGLGLALCQQIALAMDATLEVVSKQGEGSTFTTFFRTTENNGKEPRENG